MNLSVPSYIAGPFFLLILFALCVITVVGAKALYKSVKDKFAKPEEKPRLAAPAPQKRRRRTAKTPAFAKRMPAAKPVRSIEIDPDQVDRIYVKKIG